MNESSFVPSSISHKKLTSILLKAKKDKSPSFISNGDLSQEKTDLEEELLKWKKLSADLLNSLSKKEKLLGKERSPKSLMALGAMEAHIMMAMQALKTSEADG